MSKLALNVYVFVFNILLSIGLCYTYTSALTLSHYIDTVFILFLIYMTLALIAITIRGGFYDGVTYAFRRFHHRVSKQTDYLDDWKEKPLPSKKMKRSTHYLFFIQSIALMLLIIILILIDPSYF